MTTFGYRVGTTFTNGERLFSLMEVHFDANGKPETYALGIVLSHLETIEDVRNDAQKAVEACDKEIYDLDNWPELYINEKEKK